MLDYSHSMIPVNARTARGRNAYGLMFASVRNHDNDENDALDIFNSKESVFAFTIKPNAKVVFPGSNTALNGDYT